MVAVRVFSKGGKGSWSQGGFPGGLYDDLALKDHDRRSGPFDASVSPNPRPLGSVVGGVGWYRKHFSIASLPSSSVSGEVVRLRFDGVYMNSDTYLNGHWLGNHPYGYTSFEYELPSSILSSDNVLAVRVNNYGQNSRWYSGSGIFRHTWLTVTPTVYIPLYGVHVSSPSIQLPSQPPPFSSERAAVHASSSVVQVEVQVAFAGAKSSQPRADRNATAAVELTDASGKVVGKGTIPYKIPGSQRSLLAKAINITVENAQLWSPNSPSLYKASVSLHLVDEDAIVSPPLDVYSCNSKQRGDRDSVGRSCYNYNPRAVQTVNVTFGLRTLSFSTDHGFR